MKNDKKNSLVICCDDIKIAQPLIEYISNEAPKNNIENGTPLQINFYENGGKQCALYFTETGRIEKAVIAEVQKPITLPIFISEINIPLGTEHNIPSYVVMGYKSFVENCNK